MARRKLLFELLDDNRNPIFLLFKRSGGSRIFEREGGGGSDLTGRYQDDIETVKDKIFSMIALFPFIISSLNDPIEAMASPPPPPPGSTPETAGKVKILKM